ncbi:MAG: MFS transporter [Chloroflexi bacterium]|nr:MFS transporter [Chloroflexota bacterium]
MKNRLSGPYIGLAALCAGIFLAALDQTVVVTALPGMILDLQIPITKLNEAAWIVTAYLLGYTVAMPLFGQVSDVYGHRLVYLLALGVFGVGSLLCAVAPDLRWLIVARVIQAAGGGAVVPVAMANAVAQFPRSKHPFILGIIAAVAEAGGVLGPLYGATLVERLGWRWIFYINVPLIAIIAVLVLLACRDGRKVGGQVDYRGAVVLGLGLAALTIGLSGEIGSGAVLITASLVLAALALFALFAALERRTGHPLIELSMFREVGFASGNGANFLVGVALITSMVNVPLFAATVLQRPPMEGGLLLLRLTVAMPVGALLGGMLCQRLPYRYVATLGLLVTSLALFLTSGWSGNASDVVMTRDLVLAGLGYGLVISPIASSVLSSVPADKSGVASALVTVMRMIGMMVGLSILTSWGLGRFNTLMASVPLPLPTAGASAEALQQQMIEYQNLAFQAVLRVFNEVFLVAAIVCLVAIVPALLLRSQGDKRRASIFGMRAR